MVNELLKTCSAGPSVSTSKHYRAYFEAKN